MMTGLLTVALLVMVTVGLISSEAWIWAAVTGFFAGLRLVLLSLQAWRLVSASLQSRGSPSQVRTARAGPASESGPLSISSPTSNSGVRTDESGPPPAPTDPA